MGALDEFVCEHCGGPNVSWFTDNDQWAKVTGYEVLCLSCFAEAYPPAEAESSTWHLRRADWGTDRDTEAANAISHFIEVEVAKFVTTRDELNASLTRTREEAAGLRARVEELEKVLQRARALLAEECAWATNLLDCIEAALRGGEREA